MDNGQNVNMGRFVTWITSHSCRAAKASITCCQCWKALLDGWRPTSCLTALPRTPSRPWKSKSCGNMAQLSWTTDLSTSGPESMGLSGCILFLNRHQPLGKIKQHNGLLTIWKVMGEGASRHWNLHVAKATWLVNIWGSASQAGPSQSKPSRSAERDKVPVRDRIWGIY